MNQTHIAGYITRDAELKKTSTGKSLAYATVAVKSSKDQTTFIDVKAWGKVADVLSKFGQKGQGVAINGHLQPNRYTKNDQEVFKLDVIADRITLLGGSKGKTEDSEAAPFRTVSQGAHLFEDDNDDPFQITEDDMPF